MEIDFSKVTLEKAVEDSIQEMIEIDNQTVQEFEEMEKMQEMPKKNDDLYEVLLDIKNTLIDNKIQELKIDHKILDAIQDNYDVSREINQKHNKVVYIQFVLFTFMGMGIGANIAVFEPFIKQGFQLALEFFR